MTMGSHEADAAGEAQALLMPAWQQLIKASWPAITAQDLLDAGNPFWQQERLPAIPDEEAKGFALFSRMARYKRSVTLSLPGLNGYTPVRLAFYLHRLRHEAEQGAMRTPWFNSQNMKDRPHLVVIGKPRVLFRFFANHSSLRPQVLDKSGKVDVGSERHRGHQTIIVNSAYDLMESLDALTKHASPFAFIIHASELGGGEARSKDG